MVLRIALPGQYSYLLAGLFKATPLFVYAGGTAIPGGRICVGKHDAGACHEESSGSNTWFCHWWLSGVFSLPATEWMGVEHARGGMEKHFVFTGFSCTIDRVCALVCVPAFLIHFRFDMGASGF